MSFWDQFEYLQDNIWHPSTTSKEIEKFKRNRVPNVEAKDLLPPHPLAGEQGLFALVNFEVFDVIGTYVGQYVTSDARGYPNMSQIRSGRYLATTDVNDYDLGITAEEAGNEMRFINSYLNVADGPNVVMRTVFVNSLPRIVVICTKPIQIGEEILLDYGHDYNVRYILPKSFVSKEMSTEELLDALPGERDSDSDEE